MHIDLRNYGLPMIVPQETTILGLKKVDIPKMRYIVGVITPIGTFEITLKSKEQLNEFVGQFTNNTINF